MLWQEFKYCLSISVLLCLMFFLFWFVYGTVNISENKMDCKSRRSWQAARWRPFLRDVTWTLQHLCVDAHFLLDLLLLLLLQDAALLHHDALRRFRQRLRNGVQRFFVRGDRLHAVQTQFPPDLVPNLADLQRNSKLSHRGNDSTGDALNIFLISGFTETVSWFKALSRKKKLLFVTFSSSIREFGWGQAL